MKGTIRGIGIGLFLAGATYTVVDYLNIPATPADTTQYKETIQDLEAKLKTANEQNSILEKQVGTEQEKPPEQTAPTENPEPAEQPSTETPITESTTETSDPAVVSGTVFIYEGVSLYDIGKQVEDAGIIQNSRELELFLSKPEYATTIQKGQFDLTSDMTIEEMALVLTGKKVEN